MRTIAVLLIAASLTACSGQPTVTSKGISVATSQAVYDTEAALVAVESAVSAYSFQPWCDAPKAPRPPACASRTVVPQLAKGVDTASDGLREIKNLVAAGLATDATIVDKLVAVRRAITTAQGLLAAYGFKI